MSRISQARHNKYIVPGMQIVDIISTLSSDGFAAKLLRAIPTTHGRYSASFEGWYEENGIYTNKGSVYFSGRENPITLKIGVEEGLVIKETTTISTTTKDRLSMKPVQGILMLKMRANSNGNRIQSHANELLACWVVHGKNWHNRRGECIREPYGLHRAGMPEKFYFNIIDGKQHPMTLSELINAGCIRSTHTGEWKQRHSTIVAAVCDMPITMHEFKDGGEDICAFDGLEISKDKKVWGPYCKWNEPARHSEALGIWQELAIKAASPFAFHIHATRMLFPKAQLDSSLLLKEVGRDRLAAVLAVIEQNDPERFYRLIDEEGKTHRMHPEIQKNYIRYGDFGEFPRGKIVENILSSFEELDRVQEDSTYYLPRKPRIVLDTHFYLVLESLLQKKKAVYALSGRDMHRYLTQDGAANMHAIRNERLFMLLRDLFGVRSINFHIYPPLAGSSNLSSQYDKPELFDKKFWLAQTV